MATVIYLPKTRGIGEALGGSAGAYVARNVKQDEELKRAEQLGNLFDSLTSTDASGKSQRSAAKKAIQEGAITDPSDLISLVGQLRKNKSTGMIKIPAFNTKGNEVPFALTKQDLATGSGEKKANILGLTLTNKGKQVDFFEDSPAQKFIGVGSATKRPEGKITLAEWKSKYGKTKTATDKDTAIGDYLKGSKDKFGKAFQNTSINRKRAREFLDKRSKAIEVINAAFGKKTGADWTIDDPLKNQMAIIAKMQVEGFIMQEGNSAEQAGSNAVQLVKEVFKDKVDADIPVQVEEEKGGGFDFIKDLFKSDETKANDEIRKSPDYIGDFNDIAIAVPDTITSPREAMDYIVKIYKLSKEDARQFMLDNAPTE